MSRIAFMAGIVLTCLYLRPAMADEQYKQIAKEGFWIAASLSPSASAPVDACLAGIPNIGFFIQVDKNGDAEVLASNSYWSLPANAVGTVKLAVNGNNYTLPLSSYSSYTTNASLTPIQFLMMVGDLETSSSMNIAVGTAPAIGMDLDGGKTVLTAFMTCNAAFNPQINTNGVNP